MNPMFESAALTYSTYACICWAVALVLVLVLSHSPWALRILGAYAVAGAMVAASTGFIAVQSVAEDRIDQAMHLAATIQQADQVLQEIEQRASATDADMIAVEIAGREVVLTRAIVARAAEIAQERHNADN